MTQRLGKYTIVEKLGEGAMGEEGIRQEELRAKLEAEHTATGTLNGILKQMVAFGIT